MSLDYLCYLRQYLFTIIALTHDKIQQDSNMSLKVFGLDRERSGIVFDMFNGFKLVAASAIKNSIISIKPQGNQSKCSVSSKTILLNELNGDGISLSSCYLGIGACSRCLCHVKAEREGCEKKRSPIMPKYVWVCPFALLISHRRFSDELIFF